MKKILLASAAAVMVAPAAFADNSVLDAALAEIEAAYDAFEGTASPATLDTLDSLLYHIDNHGAVSDIDFGSLTMSADGSYAVSDLNVMVHDFSDEINNEVMDLADDIASDFFGASDKDFDDITIANSGATNGEGGTWRLTGLSSGIVHDFLEKDVADDPSTMADETDRGLVAELNQLQTSLDVTEFSGTAIGTINTNIASLQAEVVDFNAGVTALNLAEAEAWAGGGGTEAAGVVTGANYAYAIRSATEANVNLVDADGGSRTVRSEVEATSSFTVGSFTGTYSDYVDAVINQ